MSHPLLFLLLSLTAYRLWRLFFRDEFPILSDPRDRLEARIRTRWGRKWAEGVGCAWCSGSWVAIAVVGITWIFVPLPLPALWFGGVACAVGLIGAFDG